MSIDVAAARADTVGTGHVTHLDNAGSSLMPRTVADTVVAHLRREEQIGGYRAAAESAGRLAEVYSSLARLIGATPEEIAVLESGSSAWATAVSALPLTAPRVLLSRTEYWHNLLVLRRLAGRRRLELVVLDDDASGRVDLGHLQRELDREDVGLVALTHVPMAGAQVQPAAEVGRRCRAAGATFVLDACQSVGQLPLDVGELGCDMLVGTGRKFLRGPRGTAFVHVRREVLDRLEPALRDRRSAADGSGRTEARMLESWETSVAGRLGLGRAADHALGLGLEAIQARVTALAGVLGARLAEVATVTVHGETPPGSGTVMFSVRDLPAEQVRAQLAARTINVSTAALPPPGTGSVLDQESPRPPVAVRASVHYFNTEDEIDRLVRALRRAPPRAHRGPARGH